MSYDIIMMSKMIDRVQPYPGRIDVFNREQLRDNMTSYYLFDVKNGPKSLKMVIF